VRILALETSGPVCGVAVATWARPPRTWAEALHPASIVRREGHSEFARHAEVLFGLLDGALEGAHRGTRPVLAGVTGIAVSIGPGSFTGLRVGLAAAKTFARFGHIPIVGVPTLEAMATTAPEAARCVVPSLDALRGEVYAAVYRRRAGRLVKSAGPWVVDPAGLGARSPAGAARVSGQPSAAVIAGLGALRLGKGRHDDPDRLVPLYLREPDAVTKRRAGGLLKR
jgi:tRNA threonylcarbamoyl adenosine modification protein YeaZ